MTKGRPIEQLKLSEYERQKLELIASRPKSSQRDALQSTIILACATGIPNQDFNSPQMAFESRNPIFY